MKTLAQDRTLAELVTRLRTVTPDSARRWGTLTASEMLCHLGDASDSVLGIRVAPGPPASGRRRTLLKWFILYAPVPWPRGVPTRPGVDPHRDGTRPGAFAEDLARVIRGLEALARAPAANLSRCHFMAGPMSRGDWHRWAYKHVDHHLRQFGA